MKIDFFGATWCKPCRDSKQLLNDKGLDYTFYNIDEEGNVEKCSQKLGHQIQTIPCIFVDDKHIGGYTELKDLLTK